MCVGESLFVCVCVYLFGEYVCVRVCVCRQRSSVACKSIESVRLQFKATFTLRKRSHTHIERGYSYALTFATGADS